MPVRPVVRLPEPVLKRVADPVTEIGAEEKALAADLLDTMFAAPSCVGVAAPQIGVSIRAFSVDVTGHKKADSCHGPFVLFNPVLILARHLELAREGCLSVPDLTGNVARASEVVVAGLTPEGTTRVIEANAFEARALLHELDHLDGRLFLDRVGSLSTDVFRRRRYR
ncbi:MAG TPA: peptide deformylase [Acidimicrobiia bacterium]|jgi:peptide deformylase|nr:peptide deformylase [Actinomycetota bacterium]HEV7687428.1 peptide deformylase [Acidimicrobiia bacterium]